MKLERRARRVAGVTWDALRLFTRAQGLSWAGSVGLYLFLSVPPLMVASSLILQTVMTRYQAEDLIVEQAARFLPARLDVILDVFASDAGGTVLTALISLGFLAFSGTRAFAALTSAVNVVWGRSDRLSFLEAQLTRLWMLGVSLGLLALAAVADAIAEGVLGDSRTSTLAWLVQDWMIPTVLLVILLFIVYKVFPEARVRWQHALLGAIIAAIGVRVAQGVMGVMSAAGSFQTPYGALAGVALLATWALVVGVVVLFGAALVAVLSGRSAESDPPASESSPD